MKFTILILNPICFIKYCPNFFEMRIFSLFLYREYSQNNPEQMPRRRRLRKVVAPPRFLGYKPYGSNIPEQVPVELLYEEYEAIKLADYDLMNHKEASEIMGISRPTFARIYESARRKMAKAMVETRELKAVYGNAWMDKDWYLCNDCHARFTLPVKIAQHQCALCASVNFEPINNQ
jgi:uncharacterized protein